MDNLYTFRKLVDRARVVIFDFDGILADSERFHYLAYSDVFARHGHVIDETEYYKYWTSLGQGARGEIERHHLDLDPEAIKEEKRPIFSRYCRDGSIGLFPEVREMIELFTRAGKTLAVASGSTGDDIEAVLRAAGVRERFATIVGSDTVPTLKPAPDVLNAVLDAVACEPYECIVIEDAEKGMLAAASANIPVVVVRTPQTRGFDFEVADVVLDSHEELLDYTRRWWEAGPVG